MKREYKTLLLEKMVKDQAFETVDLIKRSIGKVSDEHAKSCVRNGCDAVSK